MTIFLMDASNENNVEGVILDNKKIRIEPYGSNIVSISNVINDKPRSFFENIGGKLTFSNISFVHNSARAPLGKPFFFCESSQQTIPSLSISGCSMLVNCSIDPFTSSVFQLNAAILSVESSEIGPCVNEFRCSLISLNGECSLSFSKVNISTVTATSTYSSLISCTNSTTFSLEMIGCSMSSCRSPNSEFGGALFVRIPPSKETWGSSSNFNEGKTTSNAHRLSLINCEISYCIAKTIENGRGGALMIDASSMNDSFPVGLNDFDCIHNKGQANSQSLPFQITDLVLKSNNAFYGKNVFLLCDSGMFDSLQTDQFTFSSPNKVTEKEDTLFWGLETDNASSFNLDELDQFLATKEVTHSDYFNEASSFPQDFASGPHKPASIVELFRYRSSSVHCSNKGKDWFKCGKSTQQCKTLDISYNHCKDNTFCSIYVTNASTIAKPIKIVEALIDGGSKASDNSAAQTENTQHFKETHIFGSEKDWADISISKDIGTNQASYCNSAVFVQSICAIRRLHFKETSLPSSVLTIFYSDTKAQLLRLEEIDIIENVLTQIISIKYSLAVCLGGTLEMERVSVSNFKTITRSLFILSSAVAAHANQLTVRNISKIDGSLFEVLVQNENELDNGPCSTSLKTDLKENCDLKGVQSNRHYVSSSHFSFSSSSSSSSSGITITGSKFEAFESTSTNAAILTFTKQSNLNISSFSPLPCTSSYSTVIASSNFTSVKATQATAYGGALGISLTPFGICSISHCTLCDCTMASENGLGKFIYLDCVKDEANSGLQQKHSTASSSNTYSISFTNLTLSENWSQKITKLYWMFISCPSLSATIHPAYFRFDRTSYDRTNFESFAMAGVSRDTMVTERYLQGHERKMHHLLSIDNGRDSSMQNGMIIDLFSDYLNVTQMTTVYVDGNKGNSAKDCGASKESACKYIIDGMGHLLPTKNAKCLIVKVAALEREVDLSDVEIKDEAWTQTDNELRVIDFSYTTDHSLNGSYEKGSSDLKDDSIATLIMRPSSSPAKSMQTTHRSFVMNTGDLSVVHIHIDALGFSQIASSQYSAIFYSCGKSFSFSFCTFSLPTVSSESQSVQSSAPISLVQAVLGSFSLLHSSFIGQHLAISPFVFGLDVDSVVDDCNFQSVSVDRGALFDLNDRSSAGFGLRRMRNDGKSRFHSLDLNGKRTMNEQNICKKFSKCQFVSIKSSSLNAAVVGLKDRFHNNFDHLQYDSEKSTNNKEETEENKMKRNDFEEEEGDDDELYKFSFSQCKFINCVSSQLEGCGVELAKCEVLFEDCKISSSDSENLIMQHSNCGASFSEHTLLASHFGNSTFSHSKGSDNEPICNWNGSVLHFSQCKTTLSNTTFTQLSICPVFVKGGSLKISECLFSGNTKNIPQFLSAHRNIRCGSRWKEKKQSNNDIYFEASTSEIVIESLREGSDGTPSFPSLFLTKGEGCTVSGEAVKDLPSLLFIPTVSSVKISSEEGQISTLEITGTQLMDCNIALCLAEKDSNGGNFTIRDNFAYQFSELLDDTHAFLHLPSAILQPSAETNQMGCVMMYWDTEDMPFPFSSIPHTNFVEIAPLQHNIPEEKPRKRATAEIVVSVVLVIATIVAVVVVLLLLKRRKMRKGIKLNNGMNGDDADKMSSSLKLLKNKFFTFFTSGGSEKKRNRREKVINNPTEEVAFSMATIYHGMKSTTTSENGFGRFPSINTSDSDLTSSSSSSSSPSKLSKSLNNQLDTVPAPEWIRGLEQEPLLQGSLKKPNYEQYHSSNSNLTGDTNRNIDSDMSSLPSRLPTSFYPTDNPPPPHHKNDKTTNSTSLSSSINSIETPSAEVYSSQHSFLSSPLSSNPPSANSNHLLEVFHPEQYFNSINQQFFPYQMPIDPMFYLSRLIPKDQIPPHFEE
ncbi:uncharacterized protein MONOS_9646 [Monocercomonoides exilis]|uniref:uncharacterized protein n=1 Tax=Monocercomonoides exilis TaxID=2049356 RepID=UPI00355A5204|nr:hypothetical protein MONOS_9646 [Monocercomonoides exilis]|eukprot:MONOS_9646.1-p1 / transcript=MONOS_9646.1 / gene=MONOS_9646 / organism=Monocercomonoides_exilis_PA203 / gene_product=unspecified product / transcript_product=unspecified product / location=Mono_scaffold00405:38396-44148(+) / protein_length=1890 / sequence_SO=supercontig / SO=protein_coding / is_pseudo=false